MFLPKGMVVRGVTSREAQMPGALHEAPLELLRRAPLLAGELLRASGVPVPVGATTTAAPGDVSSAPVELRADGVFLVDDGESKLAIVAESQTKPDPLKRWVWPAYLALARAEHRRPAVLVVFCPGPRRDTGPWARQLIKTGHPGFDLAPIVIDATTTPPPNPESPAAADMAVLGCLTGAIDLDSAAGRHHVLGLVRAARLEADKLKTYTDLIRAAASPAARLPLETLMTTTYKDDWTDRFEAKGRMEQGAQMVLRIFAARDIAVTDDIRDRVLACADLDQLQAWADKAATATSLSDVFPS
ncbi:MAG: hypothetical protein J2P27_01865 [Actinobacteria bacterium]|nr:hypothetical protein [Actinomycetota bacterium]